MAHKPKSYRLEVKEKKGVVKKYIVLYEAKEGEPEIVPSAVEQKQIDRYLANGYELKFETKARMTKDKMLNDLARDPEATETFLKLYAIKGVKKEKGDGFEIEPGFYQASKFYNEWKKKNKKEN